MQYYEEPARRLPVAAQADVLVAGAGPAGFAAAVAAARSGAKTLLVEQQGAVGGISSLGMMSHWAGRCENRLFREILARSAHIGQPYPHTIHPERLKKLYLDMLEEAGAALRLYTFVGGAIVEEGRVRGVVAESKSGRQAFFAAVTVDATGDGDVAASAGVPYTLGREEDGKMQPVTLMFKVGGVDYGRAVFLPSFESTYETPRGELQALARERLPFPAGHVLLYPSSQPGVVTCNMTNVTGIDGTKAEDLTRAEIVCRAQMEEIVAFLREYVPGYEDCWLLGAASLMGVRETRHFKGLYTLTAEDCLEARQFPDRVLDGAHFNFDVHNLSGAGLDKTGMQHRYPQQRGYTVPYGCLVPENRGGLLLTGRCISGTHMAHSNYRVMPICTALGEAAGVAAAMCAQRGLQPRDLPVGELQRALGLSEK